MILTRTIFFYIILITFYSFSANAQSIKLNHPISGALDVFAGTNGSQPFATDAFQMSPDGQRVVYWVRDFVTDEHSLHSVKNDGTDHAVLMPNFVNTDSLNRFEISPDSSRVVFSRDSGIYSVPITGGASIPLNASPLPDKDNFKVTLDSQQVIYRNSSSHISKVSITGSTPVQVSSNQVNSFASFKLSPDGDHIVYSNRTPQSSRELYSISLATNIETKIALNLNNSGSLNDIVSVDTFEFTPDGNQIVFLASVNSLTRGLYSAPISGGNLSTIVSFGLSANTNSFSMKISPDGNHILYRVLSSNSSGISYFPDKFELYHVPFGGGNITEIGLSINTRDFEFTPDSSRVIYSSAFVAIPDLEFPDIVFFRFKIYSTSLIDGTSFALSEAVTNFFFEITADGEKVVYIDSDAVFSMPTEGGNPIKLLSLIHI